MSKSFTRVKSDELKVACQNYLDYRKCCIDHEVDELVSKEMNRRFFRAKTREAALKRLDEAISDLHWVGGYWEAVVKDLMKLAELSVDGFVRLTADDAALVQRHWP